MIIYYAAQLLVKKSNVPNGSPTLQTILNVVFGIVGALALLLIVLAGLRYTVAQGDPAKITAAKNSIVYAAIGLVITAMAAVIVNFALGKLG